MPRSSLNAGWLVAFGLGLLLVILASLPPFVGERAAGYLMAAFSTVCHQIADRSPHVDGISMAVCHRCYGIYWGLPIAALSFLGLRRAPSFGRRGPLILGLSTVPMVIDWGGDVLGLFQNTPGSRMATGLVFGLTAGIFLVMAMLDTARKKPVDTPTSL